MTVLSGIPERRAALLLHAMSAQDQAWVLDSLPEDQRASLLALLSELRELQVEPDPQCLGALGAEEFSADAMPWAGKAQSSQEPSLDEAVTSPTWSESSTVDDMMAAMAALPAHQVSALAQVLGREPLALTLHLLQLDAWAWRDALLSQLPAGMQMRVRQTQRDPEAHPAAQRSVALNRALLVGLLRRVTASTESSAVPEVRVREFPLNRAPLSAAESVGVFGTWWARLWAQWSGRVAARRAS